MKEWKAARRVAERVWDWPQLPLFITPAAASAPPSFLLHPPSTWLCVLAASLQGLGRKAVGRRESRGACRASWVTGLLTAGLGFSRTPAQAKHEGGGQMILPPPPNQRAPGGSVGTCACTPACVCATGSTGGSLVGGEAQLGSPAPWESVTAECPNILPGRLICVLVSVCVHVLKQSVQELLSVSWNWAQSL